MFPCMHKCNAGCDPALHLCNAGSDRLHVHRNFVRGNEKYNIFDFGENRTERQVPPHTIFEDPWMPGAGSDRLHAHRNIIRCAEKYNIFDFEENQTSHCFGTVSFEKCLCYFGTAKHYTVISKMYSFLVLLFGLLHSKHYTIYVTKIFS